MSKKWTVWGFHKGALDFTASWDDRAAKAYRDQANGAGWKLDLVADGIFIRHQVSGYVQIWLREDLVMPEAGGS